MAQEIRIPLTDIRPCSDYDNARLNKTGYIDTQHVRFYNALPISMGGYRLMSPGTTEIARGLFSTPAPASFDLYMGRASTLSYQNFTLEGIGNPEIDRTPSGFAADPDNLWNFDAVITTLSTPRKIIYAHAAPNALDINGNIATPVYYGYQDNNDGFVPLMDNATPTPQPVVASGGIFSTAGYVMIYGDSLRWSNLDDPTVIPTANFIDSFDSKIIQGLPTSGGGAAGGLLWTSSKLFRVIFSTVDTDGNAVFEPEQIPGNSTLVSQNAVVSLNNEFLWMGTDNFYRFNGVLNILPNTTSLNFVFDNLNYTAANKIAGYSYPKYAESHWLVPLFGATECNYEIFYSGLTGEFTVNEINRACGIPPASGFPYPILSDNITMADLSVAPAPGQLPAQVYGIWQHEYKNDKYYYNFVEPIPKYYETKIYNIGEGQKQIRTTRLLNNFVQTGNINFTIFDRKFPNSTPIITFEGTFDENTDNLSIRNMGTFVSYRFESNVVGGSFFAGKNIIVATEGDPGVRS